MIGGRDDEQDNPKKKSKSQKEDATYRSIINCLSKNCKNFAIKNLSIHPDPIIRRERFRIWVTDVRNILSTHRKTSGILDNYPASVRSISKPAIDRAVKALLFAITVGQAKEIISSAPSAFDALVDLKRNITGETTKLVHRVFTGSPVKKSPL